MNNWADKGSRLCARHSRESLRKSHSCTVGLSSNSLDYDAHHQPLELISFDANPARNAVCPSDTLLSLSATNHFPQSPPPPLPLVPLTDANSCRPEEAELLSLPLSTTTSHPTFAHVHCMACTHCRQLPWPFTQNCLHGAFLFFFVIFLVVGVALTCLGFLDYNGTSASNSRAFRVLGIVALILCIGFLIAACVIVSECLTSALKHSGEEGGYHALYPADMSRSFHSSNFNYGEHISSPPTEIIPDGYSVNPSGTSFHSLKESGVHLHPCPSCSCSNLRQSLSYPENVRLQPAHNFVVEKQLVVTDDKRDYLTPVYVNNATDLLDDSIEDEDGFDEVSQWV